MKKIKIIETALTTIHLFPLAITDFTAMKLSREQALSFSFADQRSSYGVLRAKFQQDELQENEHYEGYILFNNGYVNRVAYMSGYFRKQAPEEQLRFPVLRSFPKEISEVTWHKVYRMENGKETIGELKLVTTLGTLAFEKYLLQEDAENLRQKLLKSVIESSSVEIYQNEENALKQILKGDYKKIVKNINSQIKKLKISKENLIIDDVFMAPFKDLTVIKLSMEQAMRFDLEDDQAKAEVLIAKYGQENVLGIGEHYEGYALLLTDECCIHIINMNAQIMVVTHNNDQKVYYLHYQEDGQTKGYAKRIFTFGNFNFELFCNDKELAERTRKKLVEAAINGKDTEFLNDEISLIIRSLGYIKPFDITEVIESDEVSD